MRHHKSSIVCTCNNKIYRPGTLRDLAFAIIFTVFCGDPLVVEAPGQLPSLPPPPLKSGSGRDAVTVITAAVGPLVLA